MKDDIYFNPSEECWQFLIKEKQLKENNFTIPVLDYSLSVVKEIPFVFAEKFIMQYEWLHNLGSAKYFYGLFIEDKLASVACYSDPVSPIAYQRLLGVNTNKSIIQLCRGASSYWAPKWAPSKVISTSLKLISKLKNSIAVVAYADPNAGEIGTIYQACNAIYIGKTNPGGAKNYIINGKKYHPRKVHKMFGTRKKEFILKIDPYYSTEEIHPKYRYIFLTGSKLENKRCRNNLRKYIQEYPKRYK